MPPPDGCLRLGLAGLAGGDENSIEGLTEGRAGGADWDTLKPGIKLSLNLGIGGGAGEESLLGCKALDILGRVTLYFL